MSDITILIQGPANPISLNNIDVYKQYGDVIVSCWEDEKTSMIPPEVERYVYPLPDISLTTGIAPNSTFYWAVCSMDNGFKEVQTPYVIKTRSDEQFKNLNPFIERFMKNKELFVCGNIFAKPWAIEPYHIGDHIFMGQTHLLLKGVDYLRRMYEKKTPLKEWAHQGPHTAEEILAYSYLFAKNIDEGSWPSHKTYLNNFGVVDINRTEKFLVAHQHVKAFWEDKFINPWGVSDVGGE